MVIDAAGNSIFNIYESNHHYTAYRKPILTKSYLLFHHDQQ